MTGEENSKTRRGRRKRWGREEEEEGEEGERLPGGSAVPPLCTVPPDGPSSGCVGAADADSGLCVP